MSHYVKTPIFIQIFFVFLAKKWNFRNSVLCITELKSREEMFFAKNALNVYMKCI